jgi:hypothetical protein
MGLSLEVGEAGLGSDTLVMDWWGLEGAFELQLLDVQPPVDGNLRKFL